MDLPPPSDLSRQVGISSPRSPISRSTTHSSDRSEIRHPDLEILIHLTTYKTYLEHESTFVDSEIRALMDRVPTSDAERERQLLDLRQNLKTRYNMMQIRLNRVRALLDVLQG
jgi:hypothetical protein